MAVKEQTILIQGVYPYEIPAEPKDKSKILNYDIEDKALQMWSSPKMPNFNKMSAYEVREWILREHDRMENGCWFYNNGEAVYINGAHYEYMTYWKQKFEVKFRHVDREYFFFDEFVQNYPSTFGKVVFKPRAGGFTAKENFLAFRRSKDGLGRTVGLINTTKPQAVKLQYDKIVYSIMKYPKMFRPRIKLVGDKKIPEGKIEYSTNDLNSTDRYLGGSIEPFPPMSNAIDGDRFYYISIDEYSKIPSADPEILFSPFFKAMFNQGTGLIEGKMSLVSTLGTDDILMRKAIDYSLKLWRDSNIEEVDDRGFTRSKFLRYFISSYEVQNIDDYGFANVELNKANQEAELKKIIDSDGEFSHNHIKELREMPRTIEDIINSPKVGSTLNVESRITLQRERILNIPIAERGYIYGKFIMNANGEVIFDTSKQWEKYGWKIKTTKREMKNLCRRVNKQWYLPKKPEGVVGYDPVRLKDPISKNFSLPAILIFKKNDNYSKNGIRNQFIGQYIGRQKDNDEVHEQAVFASLFFGFILSPEANIGLDWFDKNGYKNLIPMSWYNKGRGIMMTTGIGENNVLEHGIKAILKWVISKEQTDPKIPNIETLIFEETIEQFERFTPDTLPKNDLVAGALQCCLVAKKLIPEEVKTRVRETSMMSAMYHSFG